MALSFLTHIFGSRNERLLKQYRKTVAQINALEPLLEGVGMSASSALVVLNALRLARLPKNRA